MPALQVRDFPEELYQELKDYSALNHRSMAQQTVFAIDQMIHGTNCCKDTAKALDASNEQLRMEKRKGILERAAERGGLRNGNLRPIPSPATVLSEARSGRDADLDSLTDEFLEGSA